VQGDPPFFFFFHLATSCSLMQIAIRELPSLLALFAGQRSTEQVEIAMATNITLSRPVSPQPQAQPATTTPTISNTTERNNLLSMQFAQSFFRLKARY